MFKHDFPHFAALLDDVAEIRQLPQLSAKAKALFFKSLERYPIEHVEGAIEAHLIDPDEGKFKTMIQPAHVVAQIEKALMQDGRPSADEAWAIALKAQDESATVIWTQEIAQALSEIHAVMAGRDKTAARMAFKATYERLVAKAREQRQQVTWSPSLGSDPELREAALTQAVSKGLLPAPHAETLLLPPPKESEVDEATAEENLAKIKKLLAEAVPPGERIQQQKEAAAEAERKRLNELKAEADRKAFDAATKASPSSKHFEEIDDDEIPF